MYNNLLRECVQTKSLDQARKFYDLMEDQVLGKNEVTYSQFLKVCKEIFSYYNVLICLEATKHYHDYNCKHVMFVHFSFGWVVTLFLDDMIFFLKCCFVYLSES